MIGMKSSLAPLKRLWPYLYRYRKPMILGIFCVMASDAMQMVSPWIVKHAIDALKAGQATTYAPYAWGILGATLVQAIFLFLMRRVMIGVSRRIEYELRNDLYAHMQSLPSSYFNKMYTGDLMSRNSNDLSAVRMVLGPAIMYSVNTFFTFLFALSMMFYLNWKLTLLALTPLPFVSLLVTRYGGIIHERFKEVQEQFSNISTRVQENLSGIKVVKAFGREQEEIKKFQEQNRMYVSLNQKLIRVWAIIYPAVEVLAGVGILIVLWYGGRSVIHGTLSLGSFVAFNGYLAMLIWPSIALGWVTNITQRGTASMARLNEVLDEKPETAPLIHPSTNKIRGKIDFRNVTFGYNAENVILRKVSFTILPGQTVSFVGSTGSGKTTLLQLIPRLYDPQQGEIYIDDYPLKSYPLSTLREQIGFVPQDAFLFSDSIEDNIAFGLSESEKEQIRIENAARLAWFEEEILTFPKQYKTMIGERGINLSGGQKQRATLARALAKDPPILILDDSFSNVDTYTEEQILRNLREYRKGRTVILVSHRVSTIQDSDWIFVLENGSIAEQGTHHTLIQQQGLYFDLYQKQLIEEELHIRR